MMESISSGTATPTPTTTMITADDDTSSPPPMTTVLEGEQQQQDDSKVITAVSALTDDNTIKNSSDIATILSHMDDNNNDDTQQHPRSSSRRQKTKSTNSVTWAFEDEEEDGGTQHHDTTTELLLPQHRHNKRNNKSKTYTSGMSSSLGSSSSHNLSSSTSPPTIPVTSNIPRVSSAPGIAAGKNPSSKMLQYFMDHNNNRDSEATSSVTTSTADNSSMNSSSYYSNSNKPNRSHLSRQVSSSLPNRAGGRLKVVGVSDKILHAGEDHDADGSNNNNQNNSMLRGMYGKTRTIGANRHINVLNNSKDTSVANSFNEINNNILSNKVGKYPSIATYHEGDDDEDNNNVESAESNDAAAVADAEFDEFFPPLNDMEDNNTNSNHHNDNNSNNSSNNNGNGDNNDNNDVLLNSHLEQTTTTTTRNRRKSASSGPSFNSTNQSRIPPVIGQQTSSSTIEGEDPLLKARQPQQQNTRQYRLQKAFKQVPFRARMTRLFGFGYIDKMNEYQVGSVNADDSMFCFGSFSLNQIIIHWLHWLFRRSFMSFFIVAMMGFWALTNIFALLILGALSLNPQCLGGASFNRSDRYTDSFQLSWTTFSTVGYGIIYPAMSPFVDDIRQCTGVTVLVVLEAFVGMMYASFCSAILFIKVSRIQSVAQVAFSESIVIRYGSGLLQPTNDESDNDSSSEALVVDNVYRLPCPILEFRIANRMHSVMNGEIIDCTINIVASVDAKQAYHTVKNSKTQRVRRDKKGGKIRSASNHRSEHEYDQKEGKVDEPAEDTHIKNPMANMFLRKLRKKVDMKRDEGNIGDDSISESETAITNRKLTQSVKSMNESQQQPDVDDSSAPVKPSLLLEKKSTSEPPNNAMVGMFLRKLHKKVDVKGNDNNKGEGTNVGSKEGSSLSSDIETGITTNSNNERPQNVIDMKEENQQPAVGDDSTPPVVTPPSLLSNENKKPPETHNPMANLFLRNLKNKIEVKRSNGNNASNDALSVDDSKKKAHHHSNSRIAKFPWNRKVSDVSSDDDSISSSDDDDDDSVTKRQMGPKKVFSKLEVESSDHPFFSRVWTIRHRLNEESTLLKQETRELIKKNNGYWPNELNHHVAVKNSFHFDSFLVNFSGTSNADCSSCYAQHVYDFDDVNVGYTFRNMLYHERNRDMRFWRRNNDEYDDDIENDDENSRLCLDVNLLDSIVVQAGGGGEPIFCPIKARYLYDENHIPKITKSKILGWMKKKDEDSPTAEGGGRNKFSSNHSVISANSRVSVGGKKRRNNMNSSHHSLHGESIRKVNKMLAL